MLLVTRYVVLSALCFVATQAGAQIYTCTAEDGTRIFSDEKCGPDAKIVPGITTKRRASGAQTGQRQRVTLPPEELERLLGECNDGDIKACNEWTHGGGPNQLREEERRAGLACDAGSLEDCERRYCADGVTEECRRRVLGAAKVSGETWYLRDQTPLAQGGFSYHIRCVVENRREMPDATIDCEGSAGAQRCELQGSERRFARVDQAAASFCAR